MVLYALILKSISLPTMHHIRENTFKLYKYRAKLDIRIFFLLLELLMYEINYKMTLFVVLVLIVLFKGLCSFIYYTLLRGMHADGTLHISYLFVLAVC